MKRQILLLAITAAALSSCTTAYKTGQTPDDVYFSPTRPQDEYVRVEEKEDDQKYRYDEEYYDDRYLRMKVQNRTQWSYLDDWYGYDRYGNRIQLAITALITILTLPGIIITILIAVTMLLPIIRKQLYNDCTQNVPKAKNL